MFTEPKVSLRNEQPYIGIRVKTPFRGMFAVVDKLLKELRTWVKAHGIADEGPFFLRYHVIDMEGVMDIELGFMVRKPLRGDDRVKPGVLPQGRARAAPGPRPQARSLSLTRIIHERTTRAASGGRGVLSPPRRIPDPRRLVDPAPAAAVAP